MNTEMTREELEAALYIATENRRVLAQAVLDFASIPLDDVDEAYDRMLSLAQELVK